MTIFPQPPDSWKRCLLRLLIYANFVSAGIFLGGWKLLHFLDLAGLCQLSWCVTLLLGFLVIPPSALCLYDRLRYGYAGLFAGVLSLSAALVLHPLLEAKIRAMDSTF